MNILSVILVLKFTVISANLALCSNKNHDSCSFNSDEVSETDPCRSTNHQVMQVNTDYMSYGFVNSRLTLPHNTWLLFKNNERCSSIFEVGNFLNSTYCVQPGYCQTSIPWYINMNRQQELQRFTETTAEFCMTDQSSQKTALCCQQSVTTIIRSCGKYKIYKFLSRVDYNGAVCTVTDTSESNKFSNLVKRGSKIPLTYNQLSEDVQNQLVTSKFLFIYRSLTDMKFFMGLETFKSLLVEEINKYYRADRGAEHTPLTIENIRTIVGSPLIARDPLSFYYTYYIMDGEEVIRSSRIVNHFITQVSNTKIPIRYGIYRESEINDYNFNETFYPRVDDSKPVKHSTNKTQSVKTRVESGIDWMIIMYLLLATLLLPLAIVVLFVIYKLKLNRYHRKFCPSEASSSSSYNTNASTSSQNISIHIPPRQNVKHILLASGTDAAFSQHVITSQRNSYQPASITVHI